MKQISVHLDLGPYYREFTEDVLEVSANKWVEVEIISALKWVTDRRIEAKRVLECGHRVVRHWKENSEPYVDEASEEKLAAVGALFGGSERVAKAYLKEHDWCPTTAHPTDSKVAMGVSVLQKEAMYDKIAYSPFITAPDEWLPYVRLVIAEESLSIPEAVALGAVVGQFAAAAGFWD
jgi:hypothetical protein